MMTIKEAIAKAEEQLSVGIHLSECAKSPGIRKMNSNVCSWLSQILYYAKKAVKDQEARENPERLTIEQLKGMDCPVWVSFTPVVEGARNGCWCLCNHGKILTPQRNEFDVENIPSWKFYRYEKKEI